MTWCRRCFCEDVESLSGGKTLRCRACGAEHEWAGTHWRRTKGGREQVAAIAVAAPPAAARIGTGGGIGAGLTFAATVCASYGDIISPHGRFTTIQVSNSTDEDPGQLVVCLGKVLRMLAAGVREDLLARWEAGGGLRLHLVPSLEVEGKRALAAAIPFGREIWATRRLASGSAEALRILTHEVLHTCGVGEHFQGRTATYEGLVDARADYVIEDAMRKGLE